MKNLYLLLSFAFLLALSSCNQPEKHQYIEITTDFGIMKAKLFNSTPLHRENMLKLAKEGFYDDLLFHRVREGFMIQGGDPESRNAPLTKRLGSGGPGYRIPAELGAPHIKGALAAARTGGPSNPEKESSGSQFYIVQGTTLDDNQLNGIERSKKIAYSQEQRKMYKEVGGAPNLDMDYTVYGEVVEGLDVIDKIAAVQKNGERPVEDVKMTIKLLGEE
ncbi:MAG: cyclophilin family peptidyl-prolyl cis-trans isomerase [Saprospiraceae bacterium]|jgi:cyclophilin family peptidyl-prolyl cis-trans isomerase